MTRLESLHVSNTDIDSYSDCLPSNIEIYYSTKIKEKLRKKYKNFSFHLQLTRLKEELEVLQKKIEEVETQALIEVPSNYY